VLRTDDAGGGVLDLSDAVTVFVTTVGAPTFDACLARLGEQDCRFRVQVIDRVAPMSAAFQRMLDECRTPYFVQVDEDMLLEPHAVRTLHARLGAEPPRTAMFVATLYDAHLRRCINGLKIFRHAIVRRYPFSASENFEIEQRRRFEADGYTVARVAVTVEPVAGDTLGLHGTHWTLPTIYERYANLERRHRTTGTSQWFASYAAEFLARFQREPSEENFFALMGTIAGVLTSRQGVAPAKDYRTYDRLPGYAELQAFLAAFPAAPPVEETEASGNGSAPPRRPS